MKERRSKAGLRILTIEEFKEECRLWNKQVPSDQELAEYKARWQPHPWYPVAVVGQYDLNTGELHPWGITPSSDDMGYSTY